MPKVNPEILTWARETAGLTREDAVARLGFSDARRRTAIERLDDYESGRDEPSRSVLLDMASQYRRPLLAFYLGKPPRKGDRGADFRSASSDRSARDDAILDALIRDVRARQSLVRAVLEEEGETRPFPFIGSHELTDKRPTVVRSLRSLLGVRRENYYAQPSADAAFGLLRTATEEAGIFVVLKGNLGTHHTELDTEVFRGLAVADKIAPFVVINEHDARPAWSFTLLHELVHLALGQTGTSGARSDNKTEQFCDDVAGRFLLHNKDVRELALDPSSDTHHLSERISEFANGRNLSRTMVAYRAYRIGEINRPMYESLSRDFRNQWLYGRSHRRERQRRTRGGGDFYATRRHRIGDGLITLVRRMMASEALSTTRAATVLGVKPHQVQSIVEHG